jgi:hypothetical protein
MPNCDGDAERDELDSADSDGGIAAVVSRYKLHPTGTMCNREGCKATIAGRMTKTRYCLSCAQQLRNYGHARRDPNRPSHAVLPRPRSSGEPELRKPLKCKRCCGIPWAREPSREADQITSRFGTSDYVGVAMNGTWLCVGCGEAWEPEPPIERPSALQSSAGTCERAHNFNGMVGSDGGKSRRAAVAKKEGTSDV